jgi:hypothetical protein
VSWVVEVVVRDRVVAVVVDEERRADELAADLMLLGYTVSVRAGETRS